MQRSLERPVSIERENLVAHYLPKTLARTLSYVAWHSASEFGLFWDPDGSMPWKDLYWALQDDPSMRFVREAHIREILYLGLELPFYIEEGRLRLHGGFPPIEYPMEDSPPERLFHACPVKQFRVIRELGLRASRRHYVMLCAERDPAERFARRRYRDPRVFEVLGRDAACSGISIRDAGNGLYLAERVPPEYVVLPRLRQQELAQLAESSRQREKKPSTPIEVSMPGSYGIDVPQLEELYKMKQANGKAGMKGRSRRGWKEDARGDRHKRTP